MAAGGGADAPQSLSGLVVKFTEGRGGSATWKLGCDAKRAAEAGWSDAHDTALVNALRALEALQGLPGGPKARDANAWLRAQAELRFVRAELAAPAFKPDRGKGHKCSPGYDCLGCRQVRARQALWRATLEIRQPVPLRARCLGHPRHCAPHWPAARRSAAQDHVPSRPHGPS